ncbi:hypothetical protein LCGC14_2299580, partial [marine sediment metagenome]
MSEPRRRWRREWISPSVRQRVHPTGYTLEQEWVIESEGADCSVCYEDVFEADSRMGLIAQLEEHLVEEQKRIPRLIAAIDELPDIGRPNAYELSDGRLVSSD